MNYPNHTLGAACRQNASLNGLGARGDSWYEHPAVIVTGLLALAWFMLPM